jgi:hypothetical protein
MRSRARALPGVRYHVDGWSRLCMVTRAFNPGAEHLAGAERSNSLGFMPSEKGQEYGLFR